MGLIGPYWGPYRGLYGRKHQATFPLSLTFFIPHAIHLSRNFMRVAALDAQSRWFYSTSEITIVALFRSQLGEHNSNELEAYATIVLLLFRGVPNCKKHAVGLSKAGKRGAPEGPKAHQGLMRDPCGNHV